jgi:superfamily II DNA or RNA helicase
MSKTVSINDKKYTYIQHIKYISNSKTVVLCKDECDSFYFCSVEEWEQHIKAVGNNKSKFNKYASPDKKIELFKSLFIGREDVYAKRFYNQKTGKSGYVPACNNEWVVGICDKKKYKCSQCPNSNFAKITNRVIFNHLKGDDIFGRDVIGTYPMLPDETTKFLAIDFDENNFKNDITAVSKVCDDNNIPHSIEISRSGNGAHLWVFFEEPIKTSVARKLGSGILTKAMEQRHEIEFSSYDRMIPNQDTMPKGGFGNLIALPLQGRARKSGNSGFVNENFISYSDQWEYLFSVKKMSAEQINSLVSFLCKEDTGELVSLDAEKPWITITEKPLNCTDFPSKINIVKANMLFVKKTDISQKALNKIKRLSAFKNPDFYKSQAMRLPIYNKPRVINTSVESEKYLGIPRGCEEGLLNLIENSNGTYKITDERNSGQHINLHFNGELRDEQQRAVNEILKFDNGVLSATTAFGKTVVASYIITKRKVNTLILVHSSALLQQWKKSLSEFLVFEDELPVQPKKKGRTKILSHIGQLGSNKNTVNSIVDIAIMQSVVKGDEVKDFVKNYGMVIVDECHHISAFSFEKILKTVNAKYVYGLTATPVRQDGHHPIIFMQCGPIRYKVDAKQQSIKREFEHFVLPKFTEFRVADEESDYQTICSKLCNDEIRNNQICNDIFDANKKGRNIIVLTERTEHAGILYNEISRKCNNTFILSGKDKQKDKRAKLEKIKEIPQNETIVIVATGKYVGEGFDEPRLDTLFLAMPIAWKGTLAQYAGRLHRNYLGKTDVCVYDYADIFVPMLDRMYHKRIKGYSEIGYALNSSKDSTNIIYTAESYEQKFFEDIKSAVTSVVISSPKIKNFLTKKLISEINKNVELTIITQKSNDIDFDMNNGGNVSIIERDKLYQTYTVIDKRIVWYGNITPLHYNYNNGTTIRFVNETIAGKLSGETEKQLSLI